MKCRLKASVFICVGYIGTNRTYVRSLKSFGLSKVKNLRWKTLGLTDMIDDMTRKVDSQSNPDEYLKLTKPGDE